MRNLFGVAFSIIAGWYLYVAISQRARRLAERRAAGIADDAEPTSRLFVFGEVVRPVVLVMLAYLGVKAALVYHWMDGARYLSYFDLGAFLAALAAYGYWITVKTRCLPLSAYRTSRAANDPDRGAEPAAEAAEHRAAA